MNIEPLLSISGPWIHKTNARCSSDKWLSRSSDFIKNNGQLLFIDGTCRNISDFYNELIEAVPFPSYFGKNFAALRDCMNDGDIVSYSYVNLIISKGDSFLIDDRRDVLDGLIHTLDLIARDWAAGGTWPWEFPPRPFHAVIQVDELDQRYAQLPLI